MNQTNKYVTKLNKKVNNSMNTWVSQTNLFIQQSDKFIVDVAFYERLNVQVPGYIYFLGFNQ